MSLLESYTQNVIRFRWLIVLFAFLLVAAAGSGMTRLQLANDMEVFFDQGDPQLKAYDAVRNTYTRDDNIFLVFVPADGEVFSAANLAIIEQITDAAWQFPHAIRVDSLSNFQHTEADADDLLVRPLVENADAMTAERVAWAKNAALSEPLLRGKLINADTSVSGINVTIQLPGIARDVEVPEVVNAARALRRHIESTYPGTQLRITGKVAGNNAFTEAAVYDMTHIVPLALVIALLCIGGYMFIASSSVATAAMATTATLLIIITSVVTALGIAGYLGFGLTPPMANSPTMILTLAVADSLHLLVTYFQKMRSGADRATAMAHSLRLNFQAVFLTSVTTVIGFLALNFSDAPPFRDLGNVVAIGIVAAWLFSITLMPALMVMLPMRAKSEHADDLSLMSSLANWVIDNRWKSLAASSTLILASVAMLPQNQLYDVWAEYFDPSTAIRADSDYAREFLTGMNTLEFSLAAADSGGVADPDYLAYVEKFANWLREQPEVVHVASFTDIMKRLNRNMNGDDPAAYKLPQSRELAAQYLLLYEFSLPFGLDLNNQVNLDKSATRMIASLAASSTQLVLNLQDRTEVWMINNLPAHMHHYGASSDAMFAHIGYRNVRSMLMGSTIGLLCISLVLTVALRSIRFGILSLFANMLPIAVGFGIWGLLVGRVGLGLSVVSGMTMGIVVDYTVHLLSKYLIAQREQNLSTEEALRYAFSTVGVALVVTTGVLCVNFSMLGFSVFQLNAEMGLLTAGIILLALIIDFFFLPPLLLVLSGLSHAAKQKTFRQN